MHISTPASHAGGPYVLFSLRRKLFVLAGRRRRRALRTIMHLTAKGSYESAVR